MNTLNFNSVVFLLTSIYFFLPSLCQSLIVSDPLFNNKSKKNNSIIISKKVGDDENASFHFDLNDNQARSINGTNKYYQYEKRVKSKKINRLLLSTRFNPVQKLKSVITTTFLPTGYPKVTPHGYLSYSIWSWIQDLSTQLRGVIATQRVLEGVGVGREGATALSASLNFIVRDGCGMASTLLFTAMTSSKFRGDVKRWRLVADIVNDVGITLEVCATLVPRHLFLPMICKYFQSILFIV